MVDEWSGFADLLANLIGKYASVLEIEHMPAHLFVIDKQDDMKCYTNVVTGVANKI